jgi:hypothetical protein
VGSGESTALTWCDGSVRRWQHAGVGWLAGRRCAATVLYAPAVVRHRHIAEDDRGDDRRKATLDTAVAFQGLEVTSAIGVVVEDDLERMAELPGDNAGRRRIIAVPRWFAARSDNHAAYHAYLRQLEFSLWRRIRIGG